MKPLKTRMKCPFLAEIVNGSFRPVEQVLRLAEAFNPGTGPGMVLFGALIQRNVDAQSAGGS
jgi:hypothetical protein